MGIMAHELYGGCCWLCKKKFSTKFVFHHLYYVKGEKTYRDFYKEGLYDREAYLRYLLPIIQRDPWKCILVCPTCHQFIEAVINNASDLDVSIDISGLYSEGDWWYRIPECGFELSDDMCISRPKEPIWHRNKRIHARYLLVLMLYDYFVNSYRGDKYHCTSVCNGKCGFREDNIFEYRKWLRYNITRITYWVTLSGIEKKDITLKQWVNCEDLHYI